MSESGTAVSGAPAEVATSLSRGTNWWGAFVIGLAGTILVTGIVPFAVQSMGAAAVPAIALVVVIGLIVCLCMGELAALLPHRTGGFEDLRRETQTVFGPRPFGVPIWFPFKCFLSPGPVESRGAPGRLHGATATDNIGRWRRHGYRRVLDAARRGRPRLFVSG